VTTETSPEISIHTASESPEVAGSAGSVPVAAGAASSTFSRILPGVVIAVVLLAGSAGIRYLMEAAVAERISSTRFSPFPLADIPMEFGPWKGKEEKLDEYIAKKTGSTDYITRRYTNEKTGSIIDVLMLYGPAAEMGYHHPQACYPNAGYTLVGGGDLRPISYEVDDTPRSVSFRNLVFQRGEGGLADRQQVYYVWKYSDTYALDLGQPSAFGRLPGMFKIQIARSLARTESPDGRANAGNPCEDFLSRLMPIFEGKVEGGSPSPAPVDTQLTHIDHTP
jgi:hypothetical protein